MVTKIILVRETKTNNNEEDYLNEELNEEEKEQAQEISKKLEEQQIEKVYASELISATQTAQIITNKETIITKEFNELNKIIFEEQPENIENSNENIIQALQTKSYYEELLRKNRDTTTLIITHENIIRYLICCSLKLKPYKAPNFFIDEGSITKLCYEGEELISIGCINSTNKITNK